MSFNLLDTVKTLFNSDLVNKISSSLGESEGGTQKAISVAIPSVLTGLLSKAGSAGGAGSLLSIAKEASNSGILGNLGGLLGGGSGMSSLLGIAGNLFGDKLGNISKIIAGFAGIKESSASSLVSMAAPAAMAGLGKYASSSNLDTGGFLSLLNSQKDSILSAVPSGFNLAGALGIGSLGEIGNKLSSAVSSFSGSGSHSAKTHTEHSTGNGNSNRWIATILGTAAVIALLLFLFKQCGNGADKKEHAVAEVKEEPKTETAKEEVKTTATDVFKVTLPDGVVLQANKAGIEDRLVSFLSSDWKGLGSDSLKKVWFDFDNLNFETGSAKLTAESNAQIANIVAILKAFPNAKFKVGGYTDKVGNEASNKKLSQDRADATVSAIKAGGANAAQLLSAEGYGSAFATIAATASDEERKKDRRIAVSVRE